MDHLSQDFYQPTPKEEQVWQVCDSLYTENKRITYQSIGERLLSLGLKRGSNTDICRYLASWKKFHFPIKFAKKNKPGTTEIPTRPVETTLVPASTSNRENLALQQSLNEINEQQTKILSLIKQQPNDKNYPSVHALLVDIIKKQQERESHYLKALAHARDIQKTLKHELEKYKHIFLEQDLD